MAVAARIILPRTSPPQHLLANLLPVALLHHLPPYPFSSNAATLAGNAVGLLEAPFWRLTNSATALPINMHRQCPQVAATAPDVHHIIATAQQ